jgi:glycosyltransferase involved in cell wall biosynthesis
MRGELEQRLRELGVADHADLRGYVAHESLTRLYRESDLLLHVSWTEGLPQILFEAFAAALPTVATDVGGIGEAVGDGVELIPAGDAGAAARALRVLAEEPERRREVVGAGHGLVAARTLQAETRRVAELLAVP